MVLITPNEIIYIIISMIYILFLLYIWKKTLTWQFLIIGILSWLLLYLRLFDIQQQLGTIWTLISILVIIISTTIYMKIMYDDKLYNLMAIVFSFSMMFYILGHSLGLTTYGEPMIVSMVLIWTWYKTTPRCFNPVTCKIYNLEGKYIE